MEDNIERNLGRQPLADVLEAHNLKAADLVHASTEQITHKMVQRAIKGRRLNPHVQFKIVHAVNNALNTQLGVSDLFNY